jgi:hypothetical protein
LPAISYALLLDHAVQRVREKIEQEIRLHRGLVLAEFAIESKEPVEGSSEKNTRAIPHRARDARKPHQLLPKVVLRIAMAAVIPDLEIFVPWYSLSGAVQMKHRRIFTKSL